MKSHAINSKQNVKKHNRDEANHSVIDTLELPKDLLMGLPIISMEGNRSMCIMNHRGLVCYKNDKIIVATRSGSIQITGRELNIPEFTGDVVEIRGYLEGIVFLS
ncbi:MAG: YabP/YqfC family sporulation protein [Agathobacter sp.]|jgi:sporulation protein YqfC|nr:YabP/YqfC family sporulation protein [Agathobacter sp.]